jgi:hypothetical protein
MLDGNHFSRCNFNRLVDNAETATYSKPLSASACDDTEIGTHFQALQGLGIDPPLRSVPLHKTMDVVDNGRSPRIQEHTVSLCVFEQL